MTQDPVERIVFISAHFVMNAACSNSLQIRKPNPNQSLILFVYDVHICASKQIQWKKRQNKRSMDTKNFFQK